jgi:hypothetical protein
MSFLALAATRFYDNKYNHITPKLAERTSIRF